MTRYILLLFSIILFLGGCTFLDLEEEFDYDKRIIIKSLQIGNDTVEWYHYSMITGYSPDFVETKSNSQRNLICKTSYVSDIQQKEDTLLILVQKNVFWSLDTAGFRRFKISIDTNGKSPYLYK